MVGVDLGRHCLPCRAEPTLGSAVSGISPTAAEHRSALPCHSTCRSRAGHCSFNRRGRRGWRQLPAAIPHTASRAATPPSVARSAGPGPTVQRSVRGLTRTRRPGRPDRPHRARWFRQPRPQQRHTEDVCLEAGQEVVADRTAISAQLGQCDARIGLHGIEHVAGLVGHRFQRGAHEMRLARATGQAKHRTAHITAPIGRTRPTNAGTR